MCKYPSLLPLPKYFERSYATVLRFHSRSLTLLTTETVLMS